MTNGPYTQEFSNLHLCSLSPEQHEKTCGYWYTVTCRGSTPHTAFRRKSSLLAWLDSRGLTVDGDIPEPGTWASLKINGKYRKSMHLSYDAFFNLDGEETKGLSNGSYTMQIITSDDDGVKTEHVLNPNCKYRPIYDYRTCETQYA